MDFCPWSPKQWNTCWSCHAPCAPGMRFFCALWSKSNQHAIQRTSWCTTEARPQTKRVIVLVSKNIVSRLPIIYRTLVLSQNLNYSLYCRPLSGRQITLLCWCQDLYEHREGTDKQRGVTETRYENNRVSFNIFYPINSHVWRFYYSPLSYCIDQKPVSQNLSITISLNPFPTEWPLPASFRLLFQKPVYHKKCFLISSRTYWILLLYLYCDNAYILVS